MQMDVKYNWDQFSFRIIVWDIKFNSFLLLAVFGSKKNPFGELFELSRRIAWKNPIEHGKKKEKERKRRYGTL